MVRVDPLYAAGSDATYARHHGGEQHHEQDCNQCTTHVSNVTDRPFLERRNVIDTTISLLR